MTFLQFRYEELTKLEQLKAEMGELNQEDGRRLKELREEAERLLIMVTFFMKKFL